MPWPPVSHASCGGPTSVPKGDAPWWCQRGPLGVAVAGGNGGNWKGLEGTGGFNSGLIIQFLAPATSRVLRKMLKKALKLSRHPILNPPVWDLCTFPPALKCIDMLLHVVHLWVKQLGSFSLQQNSWLMPVDAGCYWCSCFHSSRKTHHPIMWLLVKLVVYLLHSHFIWNIIFRAPDLSGFLLWRNTNWQLIA